MIYLKRYGDLTRLEEIGFTKNDNIGNPYTLEKEFGDGSVLIIEVNKTMDYRHSLDIKLDESDEDCLRYVDLDPVVEVIKSIYKTGIVEE